MRLSFNANLQRQKQMIMKHNISLHIWSVIVCFVYMFSFVACSPKQTVETEQISFSKSYCLTDACNDSISLQFEIEFPTILDDEAALSLIQQDLISRFFGEEYSDMKLADAIDAYVKFSYTEYIANNRAFAERLEGDEDKEGAILSEQQNLRGRVVATDNSILTYEVEQYVYMGGAHGINTRYFYNYDMQTGKLLEEKDVFKEGYADELTKILQQTVIEQSEEFSSRQDFIDAGFEFDSIHPNGNFALTEDAISYVFNPYEIAPYVYGETEIVIDKGLLRELLKE